MCKVGQKALMVLSSVITLYFNDEVKYTGSCIVM